MPSNGAVPTLEENLYPHDQPLIANVASILNRRSLTAAVLPVFKAERENKRTFFPRGNYHKFGSWPYKQGSEGLLSAAANSG